MVPHAWESLVHIKKNVNQNEIAEARFIQARIKAKTYGVATTLTIANALNVNTEVDNLKKERWIKYIKDNRYICPFTYQDRVRNVFRPLIRKGDTFRYKQPLIQEFSRMSDKQKNGGV